MTERITYEQAHELFSYDPETGILRSKVKRGKVVPGSIVGSIKGSQGYLRVGVNWKMYCGHRIAWLMSYGTWPDNVDHINGNTADNRLSNLRSGTRSQNMQNKRAQSNNCTGVPGVSYDKRRNKWRVRAKHNGLEVNLGRHDDLLSAVAARLAYVRENYDFYTGRDLCNV